MRIEEINRVSEQSETSKQAPDMAKPAIVEPASPEKEYDTISLGDSDKESRWGSTQFASIEEEEAESDPKQSDPTWITEKTVRGRNWRVALTSTVALMALVVTTVIGAPRLLTNQQAATDATQASIPPTREVTATRVAGTATATQQARNIPINAALTSVRPSATSSVRAIPTSSVTPAPTQPPPSPTRTVAVSTATSTSTAIPVPTFTATSTSTSTSTAVPTAVPTQTPPRPVPTRAKPTVRPFPTRTLPKPAPTKARATPTSLPPTRTPIPVPTRYRGDPVPPPAQARTYVVQPGDTLLTVAANFGVSVSALAAANGIGVDAAIYPGQVLVMP